MFLNRERFTTLIVWSLLAFGLGVFGDKTSATETADTSASWSRKTIRFQLTARNTKATSSIGERIRFFLPSVTPNQRPVSIQSSHPYVLEEDHYGNRMAVFSLDHVPPFGTVRISISSVVENASVSPKDTSSDLGIFQKEEPFVEVTHPSIQSLAKSLDQSSPETYIRSVYAWIRANIAYAGFVASDLGAVDAVRTGRGDCSEYAYLVAALGRAGSVPVRVLGGYVMPSSGLARTGDYHNWNEVFLNGKWLLVDAQKGALFSSPEPYVTTRVVVRQESAATNSFVHRYSTSTGGLSIEMD